LKDAEGIKRMAEIVGSLLESPPNQELLIVVSAFGKMTNAFEDTWSDWILGKDIDPSLEKVKFYHESLAKELDVEGDLERKVLGPVFQEIDTLLINQAPDDSAEAYDQLIPFGEILASRFISEYLKQMNIENSWIDAREIISTDSCYRDARVDWEDTSEKVLDRIPGLRLSEKSDGNMDAPNVWLTQGFIGGNSKGQTTSLGREGSDFSAAIFAFIPGCCRAGHLEGCSGSYDSGSCIFSGCWKA